jgi:hypothetical protein
MGYPILAGFDSALLKCFGAIQNLETAEMLSPVPATNSRRSAIIRSTESSRVFVGRGLQFTFPAPVEQSPAGRAAPHQARRDHAAEAQPGAD